MRTTQSLDYERPSGLASRGVSLSDANFYNEMSTQTYERTRLEAVHGNALEVVGAPSETHEADLLVARDALVAALHAARANRTGLRVACLLQTEDGVFTGSNEEPGRYETQFKFRHAETAALAKFMQESRADTIDRVMMAGFGQKKMKQVAPCFNCYDMLGSFFNRSTELVLFQPGTLDRAVVLGADEHAMAYERKTPLAIEGIEDEEIKAELRDKATLSEQDIKLVTRLRKIGLEHDVEFYLTGSASGRGWVSQEIMKKTGESPQDLDVVAVTTKPSDGIAKLVNPGWVTPADMINRSFSTRRWYPGSTSSGLSSPMPFLGDREYHAYGSKKSQQTPLEITVVPELSLGMLDAGYYSRNFYLKIS